MKVEEFVNLSNGRINLTTEFEVSVSPITAVQNAHNALSVLYYLSA